MLSVLRQDSDLSFTTIETLKDQHSSKFYINNDDFLKGRTRKSLGKESFIKI